jgi:hypothetical protein
VERCLLVGSTKGDASAEADSGRLTAEQVPINFHGWSQFETG